MPPEPGQKPEAIKIEIRQVQKNPLDIPAFDIPPEGRQLILAMPPNCELSSIKMDLHAVLAPAALINSKESPAAVSSDRGAGWQGKSVSWLMADWSHERAVVSLGIEPPPDTTLPAKARVKVFYNGVWLPLTPAEILDFSKQPQQSIPPVFAAKLMVEFVKESEKPPGLWNPKSVKADGLTVNGSDIPYDLQLSVASEAPFFSQPGVLPDPVLKINGFEEAVNRYISNTGKIDIPLKLTARMPARIAVKNITVKTISVAKKLENLDEQGQLPLPWEPIETAASLNIGAGSIIEEVQFEYHADLVPEHILIAPASTKTESACLVGDGYDAAQGFAALPDGVALIGLDLYLRPIELPVIASLTLYPDEMGQPGRQPYPDAFKEVELTEDLFRNPRSARWVPFQFPQPVPAPDGPWWAVLHVESGELHWYLSDIHVSMRELTGAMYCRGDGSWLKRVSAKNGNALQAQVRLRTPLTDPAAPALHLKRHTASIPLKPGADGSVHMTKDALRELNHKSVLSCIDLKIVVESEYAGSVQFANPCIRYRTKEQQ
jgi:hypothetical protein